MFNQKGTNIYWNIYMLRYQQIWYFKSRLLIRLKINTFSNIILFTEKCMKADTDYIRGNISIQIRIGKILIIFYLSKNK